MNKINVLVADDHWQILESIQGILKTCFDTESVDLVDNGLSAWSKINHQTYDLYIIDLKLPQVDGFALIRQIRKVNPDAKIIINTMCEELWDVKRILELGVDGIVIKTSTLSHLNDAIDYVLTGEKYGCPKFTQLEKQFKKEGFFNLSKREIEILCVIAEGLTTEQIAERFRISENTVETIRKRLLLKSGAHNMPHLINRAHKAGLLTDYCM